jgi:hypothetical protein
MRNVEERVEAASIGMPCRGRQNIEDRKMVVPIDLRIDGCCEYGLINKLFAVCYVS